MEKFLLVSLLVGDSSQTEVKSALDEDEGNKN